jgi:hypothetical protein
MFHNMGLRSDGIGGDGFGPGKMHRVAHGDGDFHTFSVAHYSSSGTMEMQPVTHSRAQVPHPLQ